MAGAVLVGADAQHRVQARQKQVLVGQHHALGTRRGAAGVHDLGEVVVLDDDVRHLGRRLPGHKLRKSRVFRRAGAGECAQHQIAETRGDAVHQGMETGIGKHGAGAGVLDVVGDIVRVLQEVDRHRDKAALEATPQAGQEFAGIAAENGDPVALADTPRAQPVDQTVHAIIELAKTQRHAPAIDKFDHRLAGAAIRGATAQAVAHGDAADQVEFEFACHFQLPLHVVTGSDVAKAYRSTLGSPRRRVPAIARIPASAYARWRRRIPSARQR